jgi:hypothetical protein
MKVKDMMLEDAHKYSEIAKVIKIAALLAILIGGVLLFFTTICKSPADRARVGS